MKKKIKDKCDLGFTLIEIIVTSAIIVFLMISVWSSGVLRSSDFHVMINQENLRLLLTRAKSMTINGVFDNHTCGYGVRIEPNRAFIFLDTGGCEENNRRYDVGEEIAGSMNMVILTEGASFVPGVGQVADIVFIPPYIHAAINGSDSNTVLDIAIRSASGRYRKIIINQQALISVVNQN